MRRVGETTIKNQALLFGLFFLFIFLSGCWDAKELQNLAIVSAVGIDLDEKQPGKVLVTIQIIKPGEVKSSGGDSAGGDGSTFGGQQKAYITASSSGKTVSEAFRNFVTQVDRELYLSQNQIIVFGKAAAEQGVYSFLNYFIRTHEPRETNWILVADGKARDIMDTNLGLEKIPALETNRLIINREVASQASGTKIQDFLFGLLSKDTSVYTSFIQVKDNMGDKKIQLAGSAVFKGDKFVGQFDKKETRGLLWIVNKVKRGVISVKTPTLGQVDFGILNATSKIEPEVNAGKITMKLQIDTDYGLISELKAEDLSKQEINKLLEHLVRQRICQEIQAALKKAFLLNTDVFGFGEMVHREFPKDWKAIQPNWAQIFTKTQVNIRIRARLKSVGLLTGSILSK
jgi:spore germination protein KC